MDTNDIAKGTQLVNSWTRPFWAECEEQFPRQGDLVFHNPIVALFCELFRLFEPELIREQTNARGVAGDQAQPRSAARSGLAIVRATD